MQKHLGRLQPGRVHQHPEPEKKQADPGSILYVFFDGIALGKRDAVTNPFTRFDSQFFREFGGLSGHNPGILVETDPLMGVDGIPQSSTGQTALFTGYNGPQIMGRHVNGFVAYSLRPYYQQSSLIQNFIDAGHKATVLNAYSDQFLQLFRNPRYARRLSGVSWLQLASGQPFFTVEEYLEGKSLYMDLTNWTLRRMGHDVPLIDAKESGRKAARLARSYDLSLYEYFFTDRVGHDRSMAAASRILRHIDSFLEGIFEEIDPETQTVVISSDHGNFEDMSHYTHTKNPVGTILYGKQADWMAGKIHYLYDIPRAFYELFSIPFRADFQPVV